jgi:hypothetical protein
METRSRRARLAAPAILLVAVLLSPGPKARSADSAESILGRLSEDDRRSLEDDKMLLPDAPKDATFVVGLVIFAKPVGRSMQLLAQTGRQIEYRPELKDNQTLKTYPDGTLERQQLKIMFNKIVYHLRYRADFAAERLSWELDESFDNDLKEVTGFWELFPLSEDRTLGRMGTRVDVGALPSFLQDYATRKNVPKSLENTRRWVDSDGTWRP